MKLRSITTGLCLLACVCSAHAQRDVKPTADAYIAARISPNLTTELHRSYTDAHNGLIHFYYRQLLDGQEVANRDICLHLSAAGDVVQAHGIITDMPVPPAARAPGIDAAAALRAASAHFGIPAHQASEPVLKTLYRETLGKALRCWNLHIASEDGTAWWDVFIDAHSGEIVQQQNWIHRCRFHTWDLPANSPNHGPRTLFDATPNTNASPFGWHDTNGIEGPEFFDTRGNNVQAQEDRDANNLNGYRPDGGTNLVFDFDYHPQRTPLQNEDATISHAFYINNLAHDLFYEYGFTPPAGNFQQNNYSEGGAGNDPVIVDVQDGSSFNNATFSSVPDGLAGRMQLHLWQGFFLTMNVSSPAAIAGLYTGSGATFGNAFPTNGLTGSVVAALDPPDPPLNSTTDACSALTNEVEIAGNIAFIDRGECFFVDKIQHAQDAGAIAVIVANHLSDQLVTMNGTAPAITIPSVFVSRTDGDAIRAQLDLGEPVTITITSNPRRDGALDSGVILHEYGHGVSTRLTGGPSNPNCLTGLQSSGMGEGWSDWFSLVFTHESQHTRDTARGVGTFVAGQAASGNGIRTLPYSTQLPTNPLTYADIAARSGPHAIGEVWCVTLWDLYWDLIDRYGYDPDLYRGRGGNNLAIQLVMDGLKLQPCSPTFLDARDAILLADRINNEGNNQCLIWRCFARRGMGNTATDGGNHNQNAVSEGFAPPLGCAADVALELQPMPLERIVIDWPTEIGAIYELQQSTNLTSGDWQPLGGVFTAEQTSAIITVTNPPPPGRHYRVQLQVAP